MSRYLPLEVMNSDYSRLDKADMFALGATMFELASRTELPSSGQLYQDLRHGKVGRVAGGRMGRTLAALIACAW
jgi:hypothetical protein